MQSKLKFNLTPLKITNLVKNYGALKAVDDVSFAMNEGEVFGLLGPNGAGKTTIISTVVTLDRPTSGQVEVFGVDVTKAPEQAKMLTGFVPQEIINHGYFSVEEILEFHSGYFGLRHNRERIDWILHKLSLWDHREKKVKQLSGGMKRRLLIAKALVNDPKLLILDEPTAGVDIALRESLWQFVIELKKQGMSILLTTHYIHEAEQLCDRVGIIQNGKIRRLGPTQALIRELTKREIIVRLKSEPREITKNQMLVKANGRELVFHAPMTMGAGDLLKETGIDLNQVDDLLIREGSLEDVLKFVLDQKESPAHANH